VEHKGDLKKKKNIGLQATLEVNESGAVNSKFSEAANILKCKSLAESGL